MRPRKLTQFLFLAVQVKVDAAFALCVREDLQQDNGPLFAWCDSSPQVGADWLLSLFDAIPQNAVVQCWREAQSLAASVTDLQLAHLISEEAQGS